MSGQFLKWRKMHEVMLGRGWMSVHEIERLTNNTTRFIHATCSGSRYADRYFERREPNERERVAYGLDARAVWLFRAIEEVDVQHVPGGYV